MTRVQLFFVQRSVLTGAAWLGSVLDYRKPCNFLQIVFPSSPLSHVNSSGMPNHRDYIPLINCRAEFTGCDSEENRE